MISNHSYKKLIVVGLDGATWNIILPLIEKNKLPTFKKLLESGVSGTLKSTIPPVTGPSWLSFATGKNPGKTGIFDFINKSDVDLTLRSVSSSNYKGQSIWDYLSNNDYKTGVVAYPTLYPPYQIKGFMVSGIGAPDDRNITYPKELIKELNDISGGYEVIVNYHDTKYNDMNLFLRDMNKQTDKQFKVVLHLLKTKDWDSFIYVCSATDWIQHIMWKHIDKSHPQYDKETSGEYAEEFEKFFQKIDEFLNQLMSFDANLLIVSDHGFGPQDQRFNLAEWLENKGYLTRKKFQKSLKTKLRQALSFITRLLRLKRFVPKTVASRVSRSLSTSIANIIDLDKSIAYCLGHTIPFGGIYINPDIKNSNKYETIKTRIINDLQKLSSDVGKPLKVTIYDSEKIYKGDKVHLAPDIIFTINNWRCVILEENFEGPLFEGKPHSNRHTGSHRLKGIFLAYGKDIKKGYKIKGARIYDIAPTILHIFGLPIPDDMDGRVLTEIFESDSELKKEKPVYVAPSYYNKKKSEENRLKTKIKQLKLKGKI